MKECEEMLSNNSSDELFGYEINIVKEAKQYLNEQKNRENELLKKYENLIDNYEKLLRLTRKIFNISDKHGMVLKERENEMRFLLNNFDQGFLTLDHNFTVNTEYSSECIRIFGKKIGNLHISELLFDSFSNKSEFYVETLKKALLAEEENERGKLFKEIPQIVNVNNKYLNIQYRILDENKAYNDKKIMLIITDITEKQKSEEQIIYSSYHDKLTSLYNRAYINDILPIFLEEQYFPLSIIMVDMNGLKLINDVFGHNVGDEFLREIAKVLSEVCNNGNIAARLGGDEFVILLPSSDCSKTTKIIEKIKMNLSVRKNIPIKLSISLGFAVQETPNMNSSELFFIAESRMYSNKTSQRKQVRLNMLEDVKELLYNQCFESREHINYVKKHTVELAEKVGIANNIEEIKKIETIALLHDVGKVALPYNILAKTSSLTDEEWNEVKRCPEIGYRLAQAIDEPQVADAIYSIREYWNGEGYPRGLKGNEIPIISRIISIVDAYNILIHGRHYKKPLTKQQALDEIRRCSGIQFDPNLVEHFIELVT